MPTSLTQVGWVSFAATLLYPPFLIVGLLGLTQCLLRRDIRWSVNAQHVAITAMEFVLCEKRAKLVGDCRAQMPERPARQVLDRICPSLCCAFLCLCLAFTRFISFCLFVCLLVCLLVCLFACFCLLFPQFRLTRSGDVSEPAGNTCICIKNVLSTVNIDTASSNSVHHHHQQRFKTISSGSRAFRETIMPTIRALLLAVIIVTVAHSLIRNASNGGILLGVPTVTYE